VDIGCGIGGPLRAISAFSGAAVTGVNNNEYQARPGGRVGRLFAPRPASPDSSGRYRSRSGSG
jgi:hypothetical protein